MLFRYFLVLLIIFLSSQPGLAQYKPFKFKLSQKQWEAGKLTWDDFQGKPLAFSPAGTELFFMMFYNTEKEKHNDTVIVKLKAITYVDREISWVSDTAKTPVQLDFNQALFNTIELHERILQKRLDWISRITDGPQLINDQMHSLRENLNQIQSATKNAQDVHQVNAWLARSYQKLDSLKSNRLPAFRQSNFGLGFHWGLGYAVMGGKLHDTFGNNLGIAYGFDFSLKKATLYLNPNVGFGKINAAYNDKYYWPADLDMGIVQVSTTLGYPVVDNAKWRVSPFLGPGWVIISPSNTQGANEIYRDQSLDDFTLNYGLSVDWKIRKQLIFLPVLFGREIADYGVRTRFSVYPVNYSAKLNGTVYNLSLSFYANARFMKLQK